MLTFYQVTGTCSVIEYYAKCNALHAASFETSVRFNSIIHSFFTNFKYYVTMH